MNSEENPLVLDKNIVEMLESSDYPIPISKSDALKTVLFPEASYTSEHLFDTLSIASYWCNLPDESLLNIAATEDSENLWLYLREINTWLAKCFVVANLNLEIPEPLKSERQEGRIKNKWDAQICEQMGYYYRAMWELIQAGFPFIVQNLSDAADTPYDLFCKILKEDSEPVFMERASGDYCLILVDERIRLYEKMLESDNLSQEERDKLLNDRRVYKSEWLKKIMPVLKEASEDNHQIKSRLKALDIEYESLSELMTEALRARSAQGKIHKSEEWQRGERRQFRGNKPITPSERYTT